MRIAALAGGVGGAKLAHGLAKNLTPGDLTVIVNTGDDFNFLGMRICPDLDTVCYTLAGIANPVTGWGRVDESWITMENMVSLGGPDWFHLGDKDLGTHLERTRRLSKGEPLSVITQDFCKVWGISHTVLPMSDSPVETWVETQEKGWLPFQEYFVKEKCNPQVKSFEFKGYQTALPALGVIRSIDEADCIVICPSNPWVSIDPILSIPKIKEQIITKPVVVVSPIVGGKAIKGPAAKMFQELGITPSAKAVADHYKHRLLGKNPHDNLILIIDNIDAAQEHVIKEIGVEPLVMNTVMVTVEDRMQLAAEIIAACSSHLEVV